MRRKHKPPQNISDLEQLKQDAQKRRQVLRSADLTTYQIGERGGALAIICLCCGLGSSHPTDIEQRYCGFCKAYHDELLIRDGEEIQRVHDMFNNIEKILAKLEKAFIAAGYILEKEGDENE